jgi:hypothetical protein
MAAQKQAPVVANPPFNKVFWAVISIFFVCLAAQIGIGIWGGDTPSPALQDAATGCGALWKMAAGAISGLLGGRAAAPEEVRVVPGNQPKKSAGS